MAKRNRRQQRNAQTALARPRPTALRTAPAYDGPTILSVTSPRAQRTRAGAGSSSTGWNIASAIAGGLTGAGLVAGLYAVGVGPYWSGALTTMGGGGMALLLSGKARWFGAGLAAAGSAQLGATLLAHRALKKAQQQAQAQQPGAERRSAGGGLTPDEVLEAFTRARQAAAFSSADAEARARAEAAMRAADAHIAAMQQAAMQAQHVRNASAVIDATATPASPPGAPVAPAGPPPPIATPAPAPGNG